MQCRDWGQLNVVDGRYIHGVTVQAIAQNSMESGCVRYTHAINGAVLQRTTLQQQKERTLQQF